MITQKDAQRNYEKFNNDYYKAKKIVFAAVERDEKSSKDDADEKTAVMEMYRRGVRHFEDAFRASKLTLPPDKLEEVEKRRNAIKKNLEATKGRLSDLEKLFPSSVRTVKPILAVAPSSSKPLAKPVLHRPAEVRYNGKTDMTDGRPKTKSELLKGVDDKFGGPLLDEILDQRDVRMSDIIGADTAKRALEEAVILPAINPTLFSGLRQPVQGILLFGPPGNGKTLLARALATECGSTIFLNVSAATLTSKWVGDAEKIVRALFKIARNGQPSIIFIDEIDSILCERNEKETEVSRRMKTEFLLQMDGMSSSKNDRLLVIGATNRPDELDTAVLRRFPKRILLDLPDKSARIKLITSLLQKNKAAYNLSSADLRWLSDRTEYYSNSDLVALCREAAMVPIREMSRSQLKNATEAQLRPIKREDFEDAFFSIKPSTNKQSLEKLRKFAQTSGQGS